MFWWESRNVVATSRDHNRWIFTSHMSFFLAYCWIQLIPTPVCKLRWCYDIFLITEFLINVLWSQNINSNCGKSHMFVWPDAYHFQFLYEAYRKIIFWIYAWLFTDYSTQTLKVCTAGDLCLYSLILILSVFTPMS